MFLRVANGQKSNCASTCFPPIAPLVLQNKEVTQVTKLEKIGADLKRARIKQAEWNQRVKNLENRYREEENSVIHSMVLLCSCGRQWQHRKEARGNLRKCDYHP